MQDAQLHNMHNFTRCTIAHDVMHVEGGLIPALSRYQTASQCDLDMYEQGQRKSVPILKGGPGSLKASSRCVPDPVF